MTIHQFNTLRDVSKYLIPRIGKKILEADERKIGPIARMPQHYQDYFWKWKEGPQEFIHIKKNPNLFEKDEFGVVKEVRNVNIPVIYPKEFHHGLWGGEGVVKGLKKPEETKHWPNYRTAHCMYWWPRLVEGVVYSEVLDKHIRMHCTDRGLKLVDRNFGFDFYLLKTPVNEVYATTLLKIKREILLTLVRKELYPNNPKKRDEIYAKYEEYILPEEEADWHGLPIAEAIQKQTMIELQETNAAKRPLKDEYRAELVGMLRRGELEDLQDMVETESKEGVFSTTLSEGIGRLSKRFTKK